MSTVAQLLSLHCKLDSESARLDTELLLGHALDKPRSFLYGWPEREIEAEAEQRFTDMFERREKGEPIAHILGYREFWSILLGVNSSTLIPRPETETLVEWAIALNLPERARVLDLGTGTGAIALALAMENPLWDIQAFDISGDAVALATENMSQLRFKNVQFGVSDWFQSVPSEPFDLIVSNPPYVAPDDKCLMQGDIRFEPTSALVADNRGLADLALIVADAGKFLKKGGWLLLEHGYDQGESVRQFLFGAGFSDVHTRNDLSGKERISGGVNSSG